MLALGLPLVSGAPWLATLEVLGGVAPAWLLLLSVVWLGGLWVHTVALVAAMPGLSHGRAFYLNLTGSAASNVLPLGGAAGTALNYWSCRRWGFTGTAFVGWAFVTNLWDNALRLGLPAVAVVWLVLLGEQPATGLLGLALTGLIALAGFLALAAALLHGTWADRLVGWAATRLLPTVETEGGSTTGAVGDLTELRRYTGLLLRRSAPRVALGKVAYAVAQGLLLWLCLAAVGAETTAVVTTAAFAVERLASLAVLTPGGSGVAEVGAVAILAGSGVPGAEAAAAVLLYRTFIFVLEIPGGILLLAASALTGRGRNAFRPWAAGARAPSEDRPHGCGREHAASGTSVPGAGEAVGRRSGGVRDVERKGPGHGRQRV